MEDLETELELENDTGTFSKKRIIRNLIVGTMFTVLNGSLILGTFDSNRDGSSHAGYGCSLSYDSSYDEEGRYLYHFRRYHPNHIHSGFVVGWHIHDDSCHRH